MHRLFLSAIVSVTALVAAMPLAAQEETDRQELLEKLEGKLRGARHMAFHPVIVRAVRAQNNQGLSMEAIERRDAEWRSAQDENALQRSLRLNEASRILKTLVKRNPDFNEAFATDNQGANVAMFPVTSDYWQGDEDKWTNSFNEGAGRVFVGELELDESTQTYAVQISAPVLDRGETIGVLVVGVTIDYLEARGG